jgi:probable DNA metabolism protein
MLVIYDGSFDGWLCAVSDVYEYKFKEARICAEQHYKQELFEPVHYANNNTAHSERIWKDLQKKLSANALRQIYMAFITETEGIETSLLQYVQYVLESKINIEADFSHPSILTISCAAKKAHREKHRMEAIVQFQQTKDELYYAVIEPDFNVLPLISRHFQKRYADQQWLIYDAKRTYGLYYDLDSVSNVEINFAEEKLHIQPMPIRYWKHLPEKFLC